MLNRETGIEHQAQVATGAIARWSQRGIQVLRCANNFVRIEYDGGPSAKPAATFGNSAELQSPKEIARRGGYMEGVTAAINRPWKL
jgi:hypothetical protein